MSVEKSEFLSQLLKRRACRTRCSTPSTTSARRRSSPRPAARARSPWPPTWPAAVPTSCSAATRTSRRPGAAPARPVPVETPEEYEAAWPEALDKAKRAVAEEHEEVVELGGLYVLGTERHESRRIDNQLRGRSGRQGDPGESRFYLSLGDDLMRLFNADRVAPIMDRLNVPPDVPIESKMVTRAIRSAQTQVEQQNFEIRKNVLKYDEVLNKQRKVIYAERRSVLEGDDLHEQVRHMIDEVIDAYVRAPPPRASPRTGTSTSSGRALKQLLPGHAHGRGARGRGRRRAGQPDRGAHRRGRRATRRSAYDRREEELDPGGHARARAPGRALGARPQVARAPLRDGLPAGGHRPARHGPARPAGRVPARGLRHVQRHDGRHQGGVGRLPVQPRGRGPAEPGHRRGRGRRRGPVRGGRRHPDVGRPRRSPRPPRPR